MKPLSFTTLARSYPKLPITGSYTGPLRIQGTLEDLAVVGELRGTLGEQLDAQQSLVAATEDTFRLSDVRFRQGAQGYLEVLDAQRGMYAARQALIGARLTRLSNQVTLYKALGGGWG